MEVVEALELDRQPRPFQGQVHARSKAGEDLLEVVHIDLQWLALCERRGVLSGFATGDIPQYQNAKRLLAHRPRGRDAPEARFKLHSPIRHVRLLFGLGAPAMTAVS